MNNLKGLTLELENFGCHVSKKFTFPNSGIVLISGPSGIGKSTIFRAIYFCLTGEGQKIMTHGQKKCKVRMSFRNLDITRYKGPGRLVLIQKNKTYENEEAQAIINSIYGNNFFMSSYVPQKINSGILNLTPAGKLEYLQNITINKEEIEKIKEQIKEKVTEYKNKLLCITNSLQVYKKELSELKFDDKNKITKSTKDIQKEQEEYKQQLNLMNNEIISMKNNYNQLIKKIKFSNENNLLYLQLQQLEKKICDIDQSITYEQIKLNLQNLKLQKEYTMMLTEFYNNKKKEDDEIEQKKKEQQEKLSLLPTDLTMKKKMSNMIRDSIIKYENLNEKIDKKFNEKTELENIKSIENNIEIIKNSLIEIDKLLSDYKLRRIIQICPSCTVPLKISNNKIILSNEKNLTDKELTNEKELQNKKINDNKSLIVLNNELELKKNYYNIQKKYINELSLMEKPTVSLDFINKKILQIENDIKEQEKLNSYSFDYSLTLKNMKKKCLDFKKKYNAEKGDLSSIEQNINENKNKLEQYKILDEYKAMKKKYDEQITNINKEENLEYLEKQSSILQKIIDEKELSKIKIETRYNELFDEFQKANKYENYQNLCDKIKKLNEEEKVYLEQEHLYEKFLSKIKEAENVSISHTIETINMYANNIMEKFFDDDINVVLLPFKHKNKIIKPEINISIQYKGNELDSVNILSAGELDRVNLAFSLAINKFTDSGLLILDECLSSLNGELVSKVIGSLKEFMSNELILVTLHQANEGIFDHIINL